MADTTTPTSSQPAVAKNGDKNSNNGPNQGNGGSGSRRPSRSGNKQSQGGGPAIAGDGAVPTPKPTPSPRPGNRRPSSSTPAASDSESTKKESAGKRNDNRGGAGSGNRGRGNGGGGRGGNRSVSNTGRGSQGGGRSGGGKKEGPAPSGSETLSAPAIAQTASGASDDSGLANLQRVIAELKVTSPPGTITNQPGASVVAPLPAQSSLPPNAPPFQPGAQMYPGLGNNPNEAPRHRKAISLGPSLSSNFGSYAPQFGAMIEDAEDGQVYEEGEIREMPAPSFQQQPSHQGRSQSQSFMAPRFAALAAQQQDQEVVGPTGRPQLAPGFSFGARRNASISGPIGPPINEEDANFQFPQQNMPQTFDLEQSLVNAAQRRNEGNRGDITGMMAEQIAIQNQIEVLQQQQQALYQQQLASNQVLSFQTPGLAPNRPNVHRRVQSNVPVGMGSGPMGAFGAQNLLGQLGGLGVGLPSQAALGGGHGRRHSVNVATGKPGHASMSSLSYGVGAFPPAEGFDDGFAPPPGFGGHSRQASRADSSWRINGGVGGVGGGGFTADLAQAQAQLQSLQQFRAAAGGHHAKMPSFSFPNMLPNMMAANMMGLGGVNLLQQQQQQFQQQLQQSNTPQRKSLFAPYLPQASLPPLLAAGKLVVGILRVNKRNRSDAYVATEVLDADIYICGSKDRNRALEGDIVAVELLDVDEVWATKKEKEEKKKKKEENAAYEPKGGARKDDKKKDDVEVEGQGLMLFEDEEVTDEVKPQFAGHVVAVVERMPGQLFSGTLGLLRPSSAATKEKQEAERREREGDKGDEPRRQIERPKIVWFKPTDKRVPLIAIPTEQAPPDFVQNSDAYANKLFVACIKRHPISSLHPFGTLVEELGPIGDIEVETSALLKDCNFPTEEFTENVLKCLPPTPWTIPEREFEVRKDLRAERIFTIDPQSAKDLDDALSLKLNDDGTYEIGVHIADVSFFVKPNTALDRDARKRATSVYLVQRAVPMLPPTLSEELCSLNPGQERLAFSAFFTVTKDAQVVNKSFAKTIIKSAAKLSYEVAQDVLDGKTLGDVPVAPQHDAADIAHDVKILDEIAQKLRARRFSAGALALDSTRITFKLDDKGIPIDCNVYERREAHKLVEEFMLLTNIAVAQFIAVNLPEQALLRRHDSPIERRLNGFAERCSKSGFEMDTKSAGRLMKSFKDIQDPISRRIMEMRFFKTTQRAKYFCSGMLDIAKYGHFSLNVPLYTHFTSPIRRFADILVHRELEAVLQSGSDPKFTMDRDAVAKVAQQCNIKRDSAKLAQEQSTHLFLCIMIADLTQRYGPVVRQAKVVGVLDAAFDVLVPEFGIEKRVHIDQMPIDNHVYDEHSHSLQIYWSTKDVIAWLAENSDDEHLKKMKRTAELHAQKMEVSSRSVQDEHALFDEDEDDGDDEIVLGRPEEVPAVLEISGQRLRSQAKAKPVFEGLKSSAAGHKIQEIKELMTVPVIITADLTKSPPVIKVYSVNPYAA